jgi:hypothetical protein
LQTADAESMRNDLSGPRDSLRIRVRRRIGPILPWIVWALMTVVLILYVRQFTRNVPYMDDMALVGMMTGKQPVNLDWLWSQHNEHRPVVSRLILTGLTRFVQNDFRTGLYFNAGVLSALGAMMLLLVRRLRGSNRVTDCVIPLAILNIGQTESMTIAFALNLVLTAWISYELVAMVVLSDRRPAWSLTLRFGLCLVVLPLSGGSGLVMVPPLVLWLLGYLCFNWWSDEGRGPGGVPRAIGMGLLMSCSAIVALYFSGYVKPSHHPATPSIAAMASTTLECLSLVIYPNVGTYWKFAGLLVAFLVASTLVRLVIVGARTPSERPRSIGLIAIILSMLAIAAAVGVSRSGFGPGTGRATRYITLMTPLLMTMYIAWLLYVPSRAGRWLQAGLLVLFGLTVPGNTNYGLQIGERLRAAERRVERNLMAKLPASELIGRACPVLYPDPDIMYEQFKVLKAARFGRFTDLIDDRVAVVPESTAGIRR